MNKIDKFEQSKIDLVNQHELVMELTEQLRLARIKYYKMEADIVNEYPAKYFDEISPAIRKSLIKGENK